MIYFYLFLFFVFLSKEFFYFDEELLVVFSFAIVFSFLFKTLSLAISLELDMRRKLISDQFLSFLNLKMETLDALCCYYKKRHNSLKLKVNTILKRLSYFSYKFYIFKVLAFNQWYQRFILSKLISIVFLENNYFSSKVSDIISIKLILNIKFISEFLLLNGATAKLVSNSKFL